MILLENPPRKRKRRFTKAMRSALRKAWAARRGKRRGRRSWRSKYLSCVRTKRGGRRRGRRKSWARVKLFKRAGKWVYGRGKRAKRGRRAKAIKAAPARFIAPAPEGWVAEAANPRRRRRHNRRHRSSRRRRRNYTSWVPEFAANPYWVPAYAMNPDVAIGSLTDMKVWNAIFPAAIAAYGNVAGTAMLGRMASTVGLSFLTKGPGSYVTGLMSSLVLTTAAWKFKSDWAVPVLFGSLFQVGLRAFGGMLGWASGLTGLGALGKQDPYFNLWEQSRSLGNFNLWQQSSKLGTPEGAMLTPDVALMETEIESGTGMDAVIDDLEASEFTPDQSDLSWRQDVGLGAYLSRADYARAHALNYPNRVIDGVAGMELATS